MAPKLRRDEWNSATTFFGSVVEVEVAVGMTVEGDGDGWCSVIVRREVRPMPLNRDAVVSSQVGVGSGACALSLRTVLSLSWNSGAKVKAEAESLDPRTAWEFEDKDKRLFKSMTAQ